MRVSSSGILFACGFGLVSLSASAMQHHPNTFVHQRDQNLQNQATEVQQHHQDQDQMPCREVEQRKDHQHTVTVTPISHTVKKSREHFIQDESRVVHTDVDAINHSNSSDSEEDAKYPQEKQACQPKTKVKVKSCDKGAQKSDK